MSGRLSFLRKKDNCNNICIAYMYNHYFVTTAYNRELPSSRFVFQIIKNDIVLSLIQIIDRWVPELKVSRIKAIRVLASHATPSSIFANFYVHFLLLTSDLSWVYSKWSSSFLCAVCIQWTSKSDSYWQMGQCAKM